MFRLVVCIGIQNLMVTQAISLTKFREGEVEYYTNSWAVHVLGGVDKARKMAARLGFNPPEQVAEGLHSVYLIRHSKYPLRMKYATLSLTKKLRRIPGIKWVEQQSIAYGAVSPLESDELTQPSEPPTSQEGLELLTGPSSEVVRECLNQNDQFWSKQYYLENCQDVNENAEFPRDLNVVPVWIKHQLFGKNIKIIVVDEGVQTRHADLADNYDPNLGLDLLDYNSTPDPVPSKRDKHAHGTKCAGIIAMRANNTICGVGIAPLATLGAVRLLKGARIPSDAEKAKALLFKHTEVHISSNSWTYSDPGNKRWKDAPLTSTALKTGGTKGRGGKGLIYVFACGSHKYRERNCSNDPLRTSIYTILVASCSYRGKVIFFSEKCASIMVTTYSSLELSLGHGVISTDVGDDACTTKFSGTSASTPMVSGAIGLALEANPNLTWRDVQHLLAWTSQVAPLQNNRGTWSKNGAGFYVSHDFGFGMLNTNDLVEKAMNFQNVGVMNTCISSANMNKNGEKFRADSKLELNITTSACKGSPAEVMYLEHVQVTVSLKYAKRGDLEIILISPSGTKAVLLNRRSFDYYQYGIEKVTFDSIMTWGENPEGIWNVMISGQDKEPGKLKELHLIFYGTSGSQMPQHYVEGPRTYYNFTLPEEAEAKRAEIGEKLL